MKWIERERWIKAISADTESERGDVSCKPRASPAVQQWKLAHLAIMKRIYEGETVR
jgi:hypothetical protein